MAYLRLIILFVCLQLPAPAFAGLPSRLETVPDACGYLTEDVASNTLLREVKPVASNEHIPVFYSQCEYTALGGGRRALRFLFKFMVKEMFDPAQLPPEQLDFNAGFAEGGLSYSEKLQYPGELTYIFHDRDTTSILVITGIDGPPDGAGEASTLIASYRLIDGDRSPQERRDVLIKFPWKHLIDISKSQ
ncbi:hypothetical protein [Parahaliea aestuarii]|uniref:Uncharacterized protein n=1 Tax=Parahaliea aestuarii TaxID=1852021 RepID=A0A5C8ZQW8_9GAMM|nr:hypothetical protein [Parahaliea aestuarii]TXS90022.1 hypothetical protein FVW59_15570 [Parahaliea aestuarii]